MHHLENIIDQINTHHQNAIKKATDALTSARAAGELLLQVKATLPYGTFTKWIEAHLTVSDRQAQRYMAVAQGKTVPLRKLAGKTDTVSVLDNQKSSEGLWKDGKWTPEAGCMYKFIENDAEYWVLPDQQSDRWFHICKHYSGTRMNTDGFSRRHTVFSSITDPDSSHQYYVGTTTPLGWIGVEAVLKSYGLKNLEGSLVKGKHTSLRFEFPKGEPEMCDWYWDDGEPDDRVAYVDKLLAEIQTSG